MRENKLFSELSIAIVNRLIDHAITAFLFGTCVCFTWFMKQIIF